MTDVTWHRVRRVQTCRHTRSSLALSVHRFMIPLVIMAAVSSSGCGSYRRTAGCAVVTSPEWAPELHGYVPGANGGLLERPLPVVCTADPNRQVRAVDDLSAMRDGGATLDGNAYHVCPPLGHEMQPETPATAEKPCGPSACENLAYAVPGSSATIHLLFYDDPSAHADQGTAKPGCYYRLWNIGFTWTGRSWE